MIKIFLRHSTSTSSNSLSTFLKDTRQYSLGTDPSKDKSESFLDCDCIFVGRNFAKRFDSIDFDSVAIY